ncbi:YbgA family protein [Aestuariirhabdus sp. LZHN29]|uniref:YbgA family protein n=1 Tax=Aestuariirhabdus sp. LZHN29 TaxID=3417462 RepID=UPI003CEFDDC5
MNDLQPTTLSQASIKVGISACLLGHEVRYNGGHSQSRLCLDSLSHYFSFTPFCPEMAAGLGTPRPVLRLTGDPTSPRLIYTDRPEQDLTEQLQQGFADQLHQGDQLDGYVLMKNSPSCGLERVKVYQPNGHPHIDRGRGLFAAALKERFPLLPVEEEGRLNDAHLRENFVLRVYAHHNFRFEVLANPSYHRLLQFHSSYKYVLMAHSQKAYKTLGRLLGEAHKNPLDEVIQLYFPQLMAALSAPARRKGHTNVLMHLLGYLKRSVPGEARQHMVEIIHRYREGKIPLITPLTLLRHYIDREGNDYLRAQRYLQPYPEDLGLSNQL